MKNLPVPFDMNHGRERMLGLVKKCTAEKRVRRAKKQHEAEDDCGM